MSVRRFGLASLILLCAAAAASPAFAQPTPASSPDSAQAGEWRGAIALPGDSLAVVVHLEFTGGAYRGTIDIPKQLATAVPLKGVRITPGEHPAATFAIDGIPGSPIFDGTIDGAVMSGTFVQSGASFPFRLKHWLADDRRASSMADSAALADLRTLIPAAMKEFNVPGLAIGIVRHGKVMFAEGFGWRDVAAKRPVTPSTVFAIGSCTKAFTSFVLGTLVDEGKIDWATPVTTYLPSFKLKDPVATSAMTTRDLLTHVSGLPRHDLVWYGASLTRREIFDRLAYLEPDVPFRSKWQYQNLMFMTAGYLAGEVAGTSWENLVRDRIFTPLGMTHSNFSVADLTASPEAATGYGGTTKDGHETTEATPYRNIDAVGPAGSINSSIEDMVKWVALHLGDGTADGHRLIEQPTLAELHRAQVVVSDAPGKSPELLFTLYGMGWMVQSFRGHRLIQHGGNIDGFTAMVSFMPGDDAGVVILTNMDGTPLPTYLMLAAYDRVLGFEHTDWIARLRAQKGKADADDEPKKKEEDGVRVMGTKPSHPLVDYTGTFEHPAYGSLVVTQDHGGLSATLHGLTRRLEHYHYDVFTIGGDEDAPLSGARVQFQSSPQGEIDRIMAPLEPSVADIVFMRVASSELRDTAVLAAYVGDYSLSGTTVSVARSGDHLVMVVPGQPTYALIPYRDAEFHLKELNGYSIRFTKEGGRASSVTFVQPNGVFTAKRVK